MILVTCQSVAVPVAILVAILIYSDFGNRSAENQSKYRILVGCTIGFLTVGLLTPWHSGLVEGFMSGMFASACFASALALSIRAIRIPEIRRRIEGLVLLGLSALVVGIDLYYATSNYLRAIETAV